MKNLFSKTKAIVVLLIIVLFVSILYRLKIAKIFNKFRIEPKQETKTNVNIIKKAKPTKQEKAISIVQNRDIALGVRQTVAEIGGIKLPKLDSIVLIKPNVNSNGRFPATTNPLVIKTLVEMSYQAGASKVIVADSSGIGWPNTLENMQKSGIKQAAEQAGAEVIDLENKEWIKIKPKNSQYWPEGFLFSKIIKEVDYIISVPVIKTHATTKITLSLKNSLGLLHRKDRERLHSSKYIQEMIAEINLAYEPDLVVLDGSKSFITRGPAVGKEIAGNYILASKQRLLADVFAYQILKDLGAKLEGQGLDHPMLKHSLKIGLAYSNF